MTALKFNELIMVVRVVKRDTAGILKGIVSSFVACRN
jgi:hypothetical protein